MPQLQSGPGVYPGEIRYSGYKYLVVEVVFQGLILGEKLEFAVAGYLYNISYSIYSNIYTNLLKRGSGLYFEL